MWFLSDWHSQLLKLFFLRSNASKTLWYSFLSRLAAKQTYIKSLLYMRREAPPKIWHFTIFPAIECTRIALLLYENLEKNLYQGQKNLPDFQKKVQKRVISGKNGALYSPFFLLNPWKLSNVFQDWARFFRGRCSIEQDKIGSKVRVLERF